MLSNDRLATDPVVHAAAGAEDEAPPADTLRSWLEQAAARPLPPPLCAGNYESSRTTCYVQHLLQVCA